MHSQPYTPAQKAEIEKVRAVFREYIRTNPYLDLVWSEKLGYLLVSLNPKKEKAAALESEPFVIETGEMLCELLFREILLDVVNSSGKGHDSDEPDGEERAEFERRLCHYTALLPRYGYLKERFFH